MGRHAKKSEKKTRRVEDTKKQGRKVRRKARLLRVETAAKANEEWIKNKDKRAEDQKAKEAVAVKAKQDKEDAKELERVRKEMEAERAKAKAEEEAELAAQIARLDEQKKADSAPVVPVAVSGGGGILGALKGAMTAVKDAIVGGAESKP